ncbi:MAG: hypothetical protein AAB336_10055 [Acidobacteriota bacterium]
MKTIAFLFTVILLFGQSILITPAQSPNNYKFDNVAMLVPIENSTKQIKVDISFLDNQIQIKSAKEKKILKTFRYSEIRAAEYSYTEQRMWKEGLGLGVASLIFPPAILVALPLGFAKNKQHWFTFRSENDFAVLKINKNIKKLFIPTFEVKTKIKVE